jgi:cytochrome c oxidase assembly protein subunit 11
MRVVSFPRSSGSALRKRTEAFAGLLSYPWCQHSALELYSRQKVLNTRRLSFLDSGMCLFAGVRTFRSNFLASELRLARATHLNLDLWRRNSSLLRKTHVQYRQASGRGRGPSTADSSDVRQRNLNFLAWSLSAAICTVGLSYASVPLYRMFCQVTGYGGTVQTETEEYENRWSALQSSPSAEGDTRSESSAPEPSASSRTKSSHRRERMRIRQDARPITIRFNADVNAAMPITFVPRQSIVHVVPGEAALAFYTAQNQANEDVVGIATYNVVPAKAGVYFNKIQCFCFEEQRFKAGEKIDMPVLFFIDREFSDDPRMVDVDTIILSYTFFRAQDVSPEFLAEQQRQAIGLATS